MQEVSQMCLVSNLPPEHCIMLFSWPSISVLHCLEKCENDFVWKTGISWQQFARWTFSMAEVTVAIGLCDLWHSALWFYTCFRQNVSPLPTNSESFSISFIFRFENTVTCLSSLFRVSKQATSQIFWSLFFFFKKTYFSWLYIHKYSHSVKRWDFFFINSLDLLPWIIYMWS